jgi:hypothetical protein
MLLFVRLLRPNGAMGKRTDDAEHQVREGQINRLKLLKRQMYGRANFDLLRQRVLYPT